MLLNASRREMGVSAGCTTVSLSAGASWRVRISLEVKGEGASCPSLLCRCISPAQGLRQLAADRQTEARATIFSFCGAIGLLESWNNFLFAFRDANAVSLIEKVTSSCSCSSASF